MLLDRSSSPVTLTVGIRPDGLTAMPLTDLPPSRLVVAWSSTSPLIRSFTRIAAGLYR